jgi:hypothetical protein
MESSRVSLPDRVPTFRWSQMRGRGRRDAFIVETRDSLWFRARESAQELLARNAANRQMLTAEADLQGGCMTPQRSASGTALSGVTATDRRHDKEMLPISDREQRRLPTRANREPRDLRLRQRRIVRAKKYAPHVTCSGGGGQGST